jgi:hypothetical protein
MKTALAEHEGVCSDGNPHGRTGTYQPSRARNVPQGEHDEREPSAKRMTSRCVGEWPSEGREGLQEDEVEAEGRGGRRKARGQGCHRRLELACAARNSRKQSLACHWRCHHAPAQPHSHATLPRPLSIPLAAVAAGQPQRAYLRRCFLPGLPTCLHVHTCTKLYRVQVHALYVCMYTYLVHVHVHTYMLSALLLCRSSTGVR